MHRVLIFRGEPYEIYSYGFMLVLAMVGGVAFMRARAPRFGMSRDQVLDYSLALLLGGMIGGRAFSVVYDWEIYSHESPWQLFNIRSGGLAWHGGVLGALVGFLIYRWRSGIDSRRLLDLMVPPGILGHIIGRIGCFLNGCCYGVQTEVPWAFTFPDAPEAGGVPRHPTQLYEAFLELSILLFITLWWERRNPPRGTLLFMYLLLYGAGRFCIEFVRDDPAMLGPLNLSQLISIALVGVGLIGLARILRRGEVEVSPAGA